MKKKEEKKYWSDKVVIGSRTIYVWERLERDGAVFVKFTSPDKSGRDRRQKLKLPGDLRVRTATGRIDGKLVNAVKRAVEAFAAPLLVGESPKSTKLDKPMTLSEAFSRALDLTSGKYPTKSLRWQEVERASRRLLRLFPASTPLRDLNHAQIRGIWRRLAKEYSSGKGPHRCGARQTEVTIDALYSVASYLRGEEQLPADVLHPMGDWRKQLKREWTQLVGEEVAPARPRHTAEELTRLFDAMHDPSVDARFALAFDLGGEQRLGQVLRCNRSNLDLPAVMLDQAKRLEAGELGMLRIPSAGNKKTSPIALTFDQRIAVENALTGYLADFEALYRLGAIADFPLFPAGRMKKGRAKVSEPAKHLNRDGALKMFRRLEEIANVESIEGRGWYGVRRSATDIAEDIQDDDRVLNSITGHRDSTTRRLIYQDHQRPEILREAANTRTKLRQVGRSGYGVRKGNVA